MEITSKQDMLNKGLDSSHAQIGEFVGKANSLLATVGVGISIGSAVHFIADATTKAADLGETMSKVTQTFGDSKDVVQQMADDMAVQFGAVKRTTLDAAASFGLIFQGAGMSARAAADLSVKLTRLADDASSFYNVSLDEALQKLRSGLVGEAEPLRAFGVLLNEDAVNQGALKDGLVSSTKEMTDQIKVMERAKLIQEQLSKATGDHERTLDSLTNQMRQAKGEWENLVTNWGKATAAPATSLFSGINRFLGAVQEISNQVTGEERPTIQQEMAAARSARNPVVLARERREAFMSSRISQDMRITEDIEKSRFSRDTKGGGLNLFRERGNIFDNPYMSPFGAFTGLSKSGTVTNTLMGQEESEINKRIKKIEAGQWSGGHVMDIQSYLHSAQEKILSPQDEVQKQQLAELKMMKDDIHKMASQPTVTSKMQLPAVVGPQK